MSTGTEKLIEQALTRADEIGAKAWAELIHYYRVSGVVELAIGVVVLVTVCAAVLLLAKKWNDLDEPEMIATFGGIVGAVALIFSAILVGEGITYLLAPGGAALHEALQ